MNIFDFLFEYRHELMLIATTAIITTIIIVFIIERSKLKWVVRELVKMYSGEPSFFSKKRVESSIAFLFALGMTSFYLKMKISSMDIWAFGYILTVWLFIAGYTVSAIQKEKALNSNTNNGGGQA